MSLWEMLVLAAALAMDAFAVAICQGMATKSGGMRFALGVGLYFGGFQAAMPLVGYLLGFQLSGGIAALDHWIAFVLLVVIGARMIQESLRAARPAVEASLRLGRMLPLALATSIDALAVGVSLAFLRVQILPAVAMIGLVTFLLSAAGVWLGSVFGGKAKTKAELAGGVVLILIGLKILLEHLGVFS